MHYWLVSERSKKSNDGDFISNVWSVLLEARCVFLLLGIDSNILSGTFPPLSSTVPPPFTTSCYSSNSVSRHNVCGRGRLEQEDQTAKASQQHNHKPTWGRKRITSLEPPTPNPPAHPPSTSCSNISAKPPVLRWPGCLWCDEP